MYIKLRNRAGPFISKLALCPSILLILCTIYINFPFFGHMDIRVCVKTIVEISGGSLQPVGFISILEQGLSVKITQQSIK